MSFHNTKLTQNTPGMTHAALRVIPGAVELHHHLTPLADARPGDLVAVLTHNPGTALPGRDTTLTPAPFCVKSERGLVAIPRADLPGTHRDKADQAAEAVMQWVDPLSRVLRDQTARDDDVDVHIMHFADVVVAAREDWLVPATDGRTPRFPVAVQTALTSDLIAAHAMRHSLCRHLTEFRLMLPEALGQRTRWDLRIPKYPDLLTLEARHRLSGATDRTRRSGRHG